MSIEAVLDSKKETKEIAEVHDESSEEEEEGGRCRILKTVDLQRFKFDSLKQNKSNQ